MQRRKPKYPRLAVYHQTSEPLDYSGYYNRCVYPRHHFGFQLASLRRPKKSSWKCSSLYQFKSKLNQLIRKNLKIIGTKMLATTLGRKATNTFSICRIHKHLNFVPHISQQYLRTESLPRTSISRTTFKDGSRSKNTHPYVCCRYPV